MQLILLSRDRGLLGQLRLSSARVRLALGALALAIGGGVFYGGYWAASAFGIANPGAQVAQWRSELAAQEQSLEATRRTLELSVDALALRIGEMNAHVLRLDALGSRLTQMADLDDGEFDFSSAPPVGGPEVPAVDGLEIGVGELVSTLDGLGGQLADRDRQLNVLEDFLLNRKLRDLVHPEGRPVSVGYVSSGFGHRTDPFTGRRAFHNGVDFAGRSGADVVAVASGVVIWSGPREGYGELVEVNHGSGYVTRYAHNADNLVLVGDTVKRGQVIARMGDSGRATGPNLHFEVLRNGRAVDPLTYVN